MSDCNLNELRAIEYVAGFDQQLKFSEDHIRNRLKTTPDGWRQYRLARVSIENALEQVYDTLEPEILLHLLKMQDVGEVVIRPRPIIPQKDIQFVDSNDLRVLINATMASTCAICVKYGKDIKKCKLRKTLVQICPPEEIPKNGACPYSEVVLNNDLGEYI